MSFVEKFGPHLPYLRRFSRALTGSQESGDTYVRAALEALVAGVGDSEESMDAKVALFRVFVGIWNSTEPVHDDQGQTHAFPEEKVIALSPRFRQAFLLHAMEEFTLAEVATIMDASEHEIKLLVAQAEEEIAKTLSTNVLIIEDEPIIAADIEDLVTELGHEVDGIAATHTEAVAAADRKQPGLVLADIQLADGSSGIDAVKDILGKYDVPVIFITAFPERLLTGDKPEPAYLIPKPFRPSHVKAAISQALYMRQAA